MPKSNAKTEEEKLLDPKYMDHHTPTVKWTIADLFRGNNTLFMAYHVVGAGYDVFTPVGVAVGGVLFATNVYKPFPHSPLACLGTAGLVGGGAGMALGTISLVSKMIAGERATPPFNKDGVKNRVDGLQHNFKVRVLDESVWLGALLATGAVVAAGGPHKLGLSVGPFGYLQAASLGSAAGSVSAMLCIAATKNK